MRGAGAVLWHDLECGSYDADLPLWRELAAAAEGPVLDVGAGTGRVALHLARAGHEVMALDSAPELLAALRERAGDLPVQTAVADARDFSLPGRYGLCVVPMQTIQLLGASPGRRAFLRSARRHLAPGALLAAALADPLDGFDPATVTDAALPLPDMRERGGFVYASQPVAVRPERCATAIERVRQVIGPGGERSEERDVVRLERVDPATLAREGVAEGLQPEAPRTVPPTAEHVGSTVVLLRA